MFTCLSRQLLVANELMDELQSVYRAKHSTETALLKVQNNSSNNHATLNLSNNSQLNLYFINLQNANLYTLETTHL